MDLQADELHFREHNLSLSLRQCEQYLIVNVILNSIAQWLASRKCSGTLSHNGSFALANASLISQGTVAQWARRRDARGDQSSLPLFKYCPHKTEHGARPNCVANSRTALRSRPLNTVRHPPHAC